MDIQTLESWLWDAACAIRGPVDAPKFKDFILPLVFLKRLSDVFDDEIARLSAQFGSEKTARSLIEQERARGSVTLVRFYIPDNARWEAVRQTTADIGQYLTDAVRAVARENPRLVGVIDMVDFNATAAGQRIISDDHLRALIEVLSRHRLGLSDVEPDILGRAYEYLLRKFAEGQGQSAGEFYTPREVGVLMARLLDPEPGMTVYDPACGSGGLLIKCHLRLVERLGTAENTESTEKNKRLSVSSVPSVMDRLPTAIAPLRVFGQEINPATFAMARMNAVIHDIEADIRIGDTMRQPAFKDSAGRLQTFDLVTANPMWNQKFDQELYENDPFERFHYGVPPSSSADWGWLQHMLASLNERGRMAVVLDTGAVSRGSGNQGSNRERDIRKAFVEADLIEAVILLPENLFYNTTAPGVIIVINRRKRRPGEILLINAGRQFAKGRPKNYLAEEHIEAIAAIYHAWGDVGARHAAPIHAVISKDEAARNDYNLSPSRYVSTNGREETLPLEEALVRLEEAEEERAEAERALREVLRGLFTTENTESTEGEK
ncbi:MAG: type I restriction-modification system subunit M [candidate division KSB1 bacterium]|nr:type I restriction-modification system subunit M [candidate division KSB1 bacterium]